jgi:hypothetical protein
MVLSGFRKVEFIHDKKSDFSTTPCTGPSSPWFSWLCPLTRALIHCVPSYYGNRSLYAAANATFQTRANIDAVIPERSTKHRYLAMLYLSSLTTPTHFSMFPGLSFCFFSGILIQRLSTRSDQVQGSVPLARSHRDTPEETSKVSA